jgi:hypothetical protein
LCKLLQIKERRIAQASTLDIGSLCARGSQVNVHIQNN